MFLHKLENRKSETYKLTDTSNALKEFRKLTIYSFAFIFGRNPLSRDFAPLHRQKKKQLAETFKTSRRDVFQMSVNNYGLWK